MACPRVVDRAPLLRRQDHDLAVFLPAPGIAI
jgi:hypothetical protein